MTFYKVCITTKGLVRTPSYNKKFIDEIDKFSNYRTYFWK